MAAPQATEDYQARIAALTMTLVLAGRRAWRRLNPARSLEDQYRQDVGPKLVLLTAAAQLAAARAADTYAADVLNELDFGPPTEPGVVIPQAFVGVSGNGLPIENLLGSTVGRARAIENRQKVDTQTALDDSEAFLEGVLETILADIARASEEAALAARPWVAGYVRIAEPGACSRCLLLTGRFYLFNEGFLRHPRCRCSHVPAPEDGDARGRLMTAETPDRRFEALTPEEQDKTFGKAGAEAIREGADIGRVVNARRGMSRAQLYGRDVRVTTEGTTRRGRTRGQARGPRLMPESIFKIAGDDRDEAIRLLRLYGYIT